MLLDQQLDRIAVALRDARQLRGVDRGFRERLIGLVALVGDRDEVVLRGAEAPRLDAGEGAEREREDGEGAADVSGELGEHGDASLVASAAVHAANRWCCRYVNASDEA